MREARRLREGITVVDVDDDDADDDDDEEEQEDARSEPEEPRADGVAAEEKAREDERRRINTMLNEQLARDFVRFIMSPDTLGVSVAEEEEDEDEDEDEEDEDEEDDEDEEEDEEEEEEAPRLDDRVALRHYWWTLPEHSADYKKAEELYHCTFPHVKPLIERDGFKLYRGTDPTYDGVFADANAPLGVFFLANPNTFYGGGLPSMTQYPRRNFSDTGKVAARFRRRIGLFNLDDYVMFLFSPPVKPASDKGKNKQAHVVFVHQQNPGAIAWCCDKLDSGQIYLCNRTDNPYLIYKDDGHASLPGWLCNVSDPTPRHPSDRIGLWINVLIIPQDLQGRPWVDVREGSRWDTATRY